jgi:membrane-bound metal-dependent hydrolase YbcI (DUF457 family)
MSLPVAHGLVGASVVAGLWPTEGTEYGWKPILFGAILGILPDVDFVLTLVLGLPGSYHRGFTHSLIVAALVGFGLSLMWNSHRARRFVALSSALGSHGVLDYLVSQKGGVGLFWPLSHSRPAFGWFDYPDVFDLKYHFQTDVLVINGVRHLLLISIYEALVFLPLFLLVLLYRKYRLKRTGNSMGTTFVRGAREQGSMQ